MLIAKIVHHAAFKLKRKGRVPRPEICPSKISLLDNQTIPTVESVIKVTAYGSHTDTTTGLDELSRVWLCNYQDCWNDARARN